jgi:type I restriction enzyme S subunit
MKRNNITYQDFKDTPLGPLPKEWEVVRLGGFVEDVKEKNKKNEEYTVYTVSNIHGFISSDYFFDKKVYSKDLSTYKIVKKNYFAYNPYRINVGSLGLLNKEIGLVSPAYVVFKIAKSEILDPDFLYRILKSPTYISEIKRVAMSRGSVRKSLSFRDLSEFKIPLPPIFEQKKIVAVLSTVQGVKERAEAVIAAAQALKKSLMKHLFTYGPVSIEEAENVKLKETEIGIIPEKWEIVKLKNVLNKTKQKDPKNDPTSKFKYIDVSSINRDTLKIEEYKIYYGKNAPSRAKKLVENNDVIFATVRPTLKRVAKIDENYDGEICSTAFCVLRADENIIIPGYLFYSVARDEFVTELGKIQRGASYPAITDSDVKNQLIPLPPSSIVQRHIINIISSVDEKIEVEENKKKALEDLFKTLLNKLMTGRIRVPNLEVGE